MITSGDRSGARPTLHCLTTREAIAAALSTEEPNAPVDNDGKATERAPCPRSPGAPFARPTPAARLHACHRPTLVMSPLMTRTAGIAGMMPERRPYLPAPRPTPPGAARPVPVARCCYCAEVPLRLGIIGDTQGHYQVPALLGRLSIDGNRAELERIDF